MRQFYANRPKGQPPILPKEVIEKFLRQNAWKGAGDDELKRQWRVLELLLIVSDEWKMDALEYVPVGDYREMCRRFVQEGRRLKKGKKIEEVEYFFLVLRNFYEFYGKGDMEFLQEHLEDARESFFVSGELVLPKPQEKDDFYSVLEHREMLLPEDMDRLNEILDGILVVLGDYFHQGKFFLDFTRAIALYGGKDFEMDRDIKESEQEEFYFGFWDYFLFDYHLMQTDLTPLAYYYLQEQKKMSFTESSIIRDLLKARFTIFVIERIAEDVVYCHDLFTDEQMELPVPESYVVDYRKAIFMGHVHNSGVMLLNYITSIPASPKLRERIKREVLRQYELFCYQLPGAELSQFFFREAAAVRQVIHILTEYAQLNVLPFRKYPEPVKRDLEKLPQWFEDAAGELRALGQEAGMSAHGLYLLHGLYLDYCLQSEDAPEVKRSTRAFAAVLYVFYLINGMGKDTARKAVSALHQPWNKVREIADSLCETLDCNSFDPRYLTEEGFVQMLYAENL